MNSPGSSELSSLSSGLSSVGSLSPAPEYPSPPASQDYPSSASENASKKRSRDDEDVPPVKKRRKAEPKPRTTEHLSLPSPTTLPADQQTQLAVLIKALRKRRKIVVIAGAGISVSAGIPDFRSSNGLFTLLRNEHKLRSSGKALFDASVYQTEESTASFHDMIRKLSGMASAAKPTPFHHLIAKLSAERRLMRLYTQNVDGLETSMEPLQTIHPLNSKGPWPRTVQLHGGLEKMVCSKCNTISDFEAALFNGSVAPPCPTCIETDKIRTDHAGKRSHGIGGLRPRMVLYNEHNPDSEAIGTIVNSDLRARPDAVIVVGTSMKVPGLKRIVREMCGVVRSRKDGVSVWINREPPPTGKEFEDCWDLIVEGDCDNVAAHADFKRWDDHSPDHQQCTESDVERAKARNPAVQVVIDSPVKKSVAASLLTPAASPRSKSLEAPCQRNIAIKIPATSIGKKKSNLGLFKSGLSNSSTQPSVNKDNVSKPVNKKPSKVKRTLTTGKPLANAKITSTFKTTKPLQAPVTGKTTNLKPSKPKQTAPKVGDDYVGFQIRPPAPSARFLGDGPHQRTSTSLKWSVSTDSQQASDRPQYFFQSYEHQKETRAEATEHSKPRSPVSFEPVSPWLPLQEQAPPQPAPKSIPEQKGPIQGLKYDDNELQSSRTARPVLPPLTVPKNTQAQAQSDHVRPLTPLSPGFEVYQTSPSRPYWERSISSPLQRPPSPGFVMTQTSPSRPRWEKFVLPPLVYGLRPGPSAGLQLDDYFAPTPDMMRQRTVGSTSDTGKPDSNSPPVELFSPGLAFDARKVEHQGGVRRLKRMSEDIVSPTSVPQSMVDLLN